MKPTHAALFVAVVTGLAAPPPLAQAQDTCLVLTSTQVCQRYRYDSLGRVTGMAFVKPGPTSSTPPQAGYAGYYMDLNGNRVYRTAFSYLPATNGILPSGALMTVEQKLLSANGAYRLQFQDDGNIVLLNLSCPNRPLWGTGSYGQPTLRFFMQADGVLVLYNAGGGAVWNSPTSNQPGAYLQLQDDGNLVIKNPGGAIVWQTGTGPCPPPLAAGSTIPLAVAKGGEK